MTSFNSGTSLERSIRSVYDQTYTNWEIILVDNGSSNKETLNVLESIESGVLKDSRVKIFKLHSDYGNNAISKNYALMHISG